MKKKAATVEDEVKVEVKSAEIVDPNFDREDDRHNSPANDLANKEMSAMALADIIGLNQGAKVWVSKSFDATEQKKAIDWANIFIENGVISELPLILK